jgi:methionyl-tRNA formyltransferase
MKVIILGTTRHLAWLIDWTIKKKVEIIYVVTEEHYGDNSVEKICNKYKIPIVEYEFLENCLSNVEVEIDIILSFKYSKLIKEPLISIAKFGCVNFHPGILPDFRGRGGHSIAILYKLSHWGATSHLINEKFDEGPIIEVIKYSFDYEIESAYSLEAKTMIIMRRLFINLIMNLLSEKPIHFQPNNPLKGTYFSKRKIEMLSILQPLDDYELKSRAFWYPPNYGAHLIQDGKKFIITTKDLLDEYGRITFEDDTSI